MAKKPFKHKFLRTVTSRAMSEQARENYDKIDWSDDGKSDKHPSETEKKNESNI